MRVKAAYHFKTVAAASAAALALAFCALPLAMADVYINVMAVNGAQEHKDTPVKFDLPGDIKAEDIVDTDGLQLDYDVNNANYVASGTVSLDPKGSKTFRIRVKDIWRTPQDQIDQIKAEIDKGYEQVGKLRDAKNAQALKDQLLKKLDYITQAQTGKADTVEKRIDAFRAYSKQLQHIKDQALAVDFWRSQPGEDEEKVFHLKVEVANAPNNKSKIVKQKVSLPSEIKPQDVVDDQGFEVRFDRDKQQVFLFKEEEMAPSEKKEYLVGIRDIWFIPQRDIDYLRSRADYAYDFLKSSKFAQSAKFLFDQAGILLKGIEQSQAQTLPIKEHISSFRVNQKALEAARMSVENLEKLLAILREDLEKSRVENVLQKMRSLKGMSNVAKQMFDKKPTASTAWSFIGWVLGFVGILTLINFVIWMMRSGGDKGKSPDQPSAPPEPAAKAQKK